MKSSYENNVMQLFSYSDVMHPVVTECEKAMSEWDYEYIEGWLNDYSEGTIHEVVLGLVPYGYESVAREELHNLHKRMKAVLNDIDSLYFEIKDEFWFE